MIYVPDHGESLGEGGLFLHGCLRHRTARADLRRDGVVDVGGLCQLTGHRSGCLRQRAAQLASHDHLFHSLLACWTVRTALSTDRTLIWPPPATAELGLVAWLTDPLRRPLE